ncbi:MAG TPA: polysaccharide biosynthesis/export family protein [Gemmatimonadaceae bacterium]|nr:polysaccharide biosynthesis/export family protein [Gemmatimonadaceae bacterium]
MACLLLAAAAIGCASPAPSPTPAPVSRADQPFSLEPGDVVRVEVWREKDLSGEFQVDERGRLTLPMLGSLSVVNRPWDGLRDSLLTAYGEQLRNPSVVLTPLRRVQVLGEVTKPGNYLADPTLSLAGLVALAGGATPGGDLRRVRVVRAGKTIVNSASVESLLLQAGVKSNDQIFVDRRPWVERNGQFLASTLISTAGIVIALIRR